MNDQKLPVAKNYEFGAEEQEPTDDANVGEIRRTLDALRVGIFRLSGELRILGDQLDPILSGYQEDEEEIKTQEVKTDLGKFILRLIEKVDENIFSVIEIRKRLEL